ncbi:MAG: pyridoxal phosphate-dependent aminotransferase [Chloroflexota bacterium]
MTALACDDTPVFAVPDSALIPVSPHLAAMQPFEPNRMFFIRQSLDVYKQRNPGAPVFDASQGDGGASLPGTPARILQRAAELQIEHGTAYDLPNGSEAYRRAVVEKYWRLDSGLGIGPQNVLATSGGRDALQKAYMAMLHLGHRRQGDVIITSRVPWVCYTWGPYGIGTNTIWAPGKAENGWAYSEDSIRETIAFAHQHDRKVAGLILTSPDNPTGHTYTAEEQARIAQAALQAGAAYVIFDWMYHYVTDEQPMDLNTFLPLFSAQERQRLMFLDGITKSLGGSNIRNCHLIASEEVTRFLTVWSTHTIVPTFYSMAVAMAAYEAGFEAVSRPLIEPVNASRNALRAFLDQHDFEYILGKGYYTFIHVKRWLQAQGWQESAPLGKYLAEEFGLAVVPGEFFSPYGREWLRFSYALPVEKTLAAVQRLLEGLTSLEK